jgi:hypothetical protein
MMDGGMMGILEIILPSMIQPKASHLPVGHLQTPFTKP